MKLLHKEAVSSSKERLTIDWFSQTVTELRSELAELQQASSNASRSMQQHNSVVREEVAEMKNEFRRVNLELSALKVRQETTERIVKDLRADAIEYGSDNKRAKVSEHVLYMCVLYSFFPRGTTFMVIRLICLMNWNALAKRRTHVCIYTNFNTTTTKLKYFTRARYKRGLMATHVVYCADVFILPWRYNKKHATKKAFYSTKCSDKYY